VELPPVVTDCVVVPASEVTLVGAPPALAATILTETELDALFLMHTVTESTLQTPTDGVLKTKPKPLLAADVKICGDAALVLEVQVPERIESTTTAASAGDDSSSARSGATSSKLPRCRAILRWRRGGGAGRAMRSLTTASASRA
jgi:hypothetical protein